MPRGIPNKKYQEMLAAEEAAKAQEAVIEEPEVVSETVEEIPQEVVEPEAPAIEEIDETPVTVEDTPEEHQSIEPEEEIIPEPVVEQPAEPEPEPVVEEIKLPEPADDAENKGKFVTIPVKVYRSPSPSSPFKVISGTVQRTGAIVNGMTEVNYMKYGCGLIKGYISEV